jgi:hypothetical protein
LKDKIDELVDKLMKHGLLSKSCEDKDYGPILIFIRTFITVIDDSFLESEIRKIRSKHELLLSVDVSFHKIINSLTEPIKRRNQGGPICIPSYIFSNTGKEFKDFCNRNNITKYIDSRTIFKVLKIIEQRYFLSKKNISIDKYYELIRSFVNKINQDIMKKNSSTLNKKAHLHPNPMINENLIIHLFLEMVLSSAVCVFTENITLTKDIISSLSEENKNFQDQELIKKFEKKNGDISTKKSVEKESTLDLKEEEEKKDKKELDKEEDNKSEFFTVVEEEKSDIESVISDTSKLSISSIMSNQDPEIINLKKLINKLVLDTQELKITIAQNNGALQYCKQEEERTKILNTIERLKYKLEEQENLLNNLKIEYKKLKNDKNINVYFNSEV